MGMGTHMVVASYDALKFADKKVTLPGGGKDGLGMLVPLPRGFLTVRCRFGMEPV